MEPITLLLDGLILGVVSYFLVWTVHHASIFENLIAWAAMSNTFIKRIIACSTCLTYHTSLVVVSIPALLLVWDPGKWFITWCITCCISLCLYSRKFILPDDE